MTNSAGTLFVVGTPIGNLEDITLRALKTLSRVDLIAAEDTRRTAKLLAHYFIKCPLITYHDHNKKRQAPLLIEKLLKGLDIALVCDAGTPGIADPAYHLIGIAIKENITIVPVPGVSAILTAVSVSGLPTDQFTFVGFLPRKAKKRKELFETLTGRGETTVFLESPHRLIKTLAELSERFPQRRLVLSRELTKVHEEFVRGNCQEVYQVMRDKLVKGECTLVLEGIATEKR